jgi:hypothetical protein
MTAQDFVTKYKAVRSSQTRRMGIAAAVGWAFMLSGFIWCRPLITFLENRIPPDWAASFNGYSALGIVGICLLAFAFVQRYFLKRDGVPCPKCHEPLLGVAGRMVLMTGNCGFCGERVLDGDSVEPQGAVSS